MENNPNSQDKNFVFTIKPSKNFYLGEGKFKRFLASYFFIELIISIILLVPLAILILFQLYSMFIHRQYLFLFYTVLFSGLLIWLLRGLRIYFFKTRKLTINAKGIFINNTHTIEWKNVKGYYVEDHFLFIVSNLPNVLPLAAYQKESTIRLKLDDQAETAGDACANFTTRINTRN